MSFFKRTKDSDKKRDKKLNRESSTKFKTPKKDETSKAFEEVRFLSDGSVEGMLGMTLCNSFYLFFNMNGFNTVQLYH